MFAQNENTSKKTLKQIMESLHLDTMFASYNVHFATYNMDKKQTIQLVTNGHALRTILKRSQNMMNGAYPFLGQQLLALVLLNPRIKS
jgi:hypothetical protein